MSILHKIGWFFVRLRSRIVVAWRRTSHRAELKARKELNALTLTHEDTYDVRSPACPKCGVHGVPTGRYHSVRPPIAEYGCVACRCTYHVYVSVKHARARPR